VIGDAGRTGSRDSVAGLDPGPEIRKFTTGVPERSSDTWVNLEFQGVVLDINDDGTAASIEPIRRECEPPSAESDA
jgi:calcineurin-like phosphoesterase